MLSYTDCLGFSLLSDAAIAALARHQRVPEVIACGLGNRLLRTRQGVQTIRRCLEKDIVAAERRRDPDTVRQLRQALDRLNATVWPQPQWLPSEATDSRLHRAA